MKVVFSFKGNLTKTGWIALSHTMTTIRQEWDIDNVVLDKGQIIINIKEG